MIPEVVGRYLLFPSYNALNLFIHFNIPPSHPVLAAYVRWVLQSLKTHRGGGV